jgi:hypothetical protein
VPTDLAMLLEQDTISLPERPPITLVVAVLAPAHVHQLFPPYPTD